MGRNDEADAEIAKTRKLQPELIQSLTYLAETEFYRGRNDLSMIHVRNAYAADPQYGSLAAWIGNGYANMGGREEAQVWIEHAIDTSPTKYSVWMHAIQASKRLGDWAGAVAMSRRALEVTANHEDAIRTLAQNAILEGRVEEGVASLREFYPYLFADDIEFSKVWQLDSAVIVAQSMVVAGENELAQRMLDAASALIDRYCGAQPDATMQYWHCFWRPRIAALRGDREQTLALLRHEIIERNHRFAVQDYDLPEFDFVRDDPEFQQLVGIVRDDLARQLQNVREMDRRGELAYFRDRLPK
jgi:tetratricopeptide (TPR) repeat protein